MYLYTLGKDICTSLQCCTHFLHSPYSLFSLPSHFQEQLNYELPHTERISYESALLRRRRETVISGGAGWKPGCSHAFRNQHHWLSSLTGSFAGTPYTRDWIPIVAWLKRYLCVCVCLCVWRWLKGGGKLDSSCSLALRLVTLDRCTKPQKLYGSRKCD